MVLKKTFKEIKTKKEEQLFNENIQNNLSIIKSLNNFDINQYLSKNYQLRKLKKSNNNNNFNKLSIKEEMDKSFKEIKSIQDEEGVWSSNRIFHDFKIQEKNNLILKYIIQFLKTDNFNNLDPSEKIMFKDENSFNELRGLMHQINIKLLEQNSNENILNTFYQFNTNDKDDLIKNIKKAQNQLKELAKINDVFGFDNWNDFSTFVEVTGDSITNANIKGSFSDLRAKPNDKFGKYNPNDPNESLRSSYRNRFIYSINGDNIVIRSKVRASDFNNDNWASTYYAIKELAEISLDKGAVPENFLDDNNKIKIDEVYNLNHFDTEHLKYIYDSLLVPITKEIVQISTIIG
jgi:hypothetical protein